MDWDLWGAPCDPEDHNLCAPLKWLFDFCFHSGLDLIQEDALNEKLCIQVLRILITKADTEIDELEQDLIFLQSELACIENEEWSKFVCNALIAKINSLDASVKSLRDEKADDIEFQSLMHAQPVERLHEILKAVLESYFCKNDAQPIKGCDTDSSFHAPKLEAGFTVEGIKSNSSCSISMQKGNCNNMQDLTSKCADKEKHHVEKLEHQPTDVGVNNAISDSSKHADGSSNAMKKSSCSDSPISSGDFKEHSPVSTSQVIFGSSVKPMVLKTDPSEKIKDVDFKKKMSAEGFCVPNAVDYLEGLYDFTLDETVEPIPKEPQVDYLSNNSGKQTGKELSGKGISRNLPDGKEKNLVQKLKVEENGAITLLLEQQEKKGKCAIMLQPKEEEMTLADVEMSMKGKKRQKSLAIVEWKAIKREKLDPVSLPLKKSLHIPLIAELGSDSEVMPIPSCTVMEKMKMAELRKIAKSNKFSKYYQLNKKELIQLLASRNGGK